VKKGAKAENQVALGKEKSWKTGKAQTGEPLRREVKKESKPVMLGKEVPTLEEGGRLGTNWEFFEPLANENEASRGSTVYEEGLAKQNLKKKKPGRETNNAARGAE